MQQSNIELDESLHQFVTIWKLIGRRFPQVDQTDRLGLAITWPDTQSFLQRHFSNRTFHGCTHTARTSAKRSCIYACPYEWGPIRGVSRQCEWDRQGKLTLDPGSSKVCPGFSDDRHGGRYPPDGSTRTRLFGSSESWMTRRYRISPNLTVFHTMYRSRRVSPW
jgi:hypothetical protein